MILAENHTLLTGFSGLVILVLIIWLVVRFLR